MEKISSQLLCMTYWLQLLSYKEIMYAMLFTFKGVVWSLENMPSLFFIFHNLCIEIVQKLKKFIEIYLKDSIYRKK